jgi:hypothetical protein
MNWFHDEKSETIETQTDANQLNNDIFLILPNIVSITVGELNFKTTIEKIYELRKGFIAGLALTDEKNTCVLLVEYIDYSQNLSLKVLKKENTNQFYPIIKIDEIINSWKNISLTKQKTDNYQDTTTNVQLTSEKLRDLHFKFGYTKTLKELLYLEHLENDKKEHPYEQPRKTNADVLTDIDSKWTQIKQAQDNSCYIIHTDSRKIANAIKNKDPEKIKFSTALKDKGYKTFFSRKEFLSQMIP